MYIILLCSVLGAVYNKKHTADFEHTVWPRFLPPSLHNSKWSLLQRNNTTYGTTVNSVLIQQLWLTYHYVPVPQTLR